MRDLLKPSPDLNRGPIAKMKRLQSKGFKVGNVQQFLDLSPEESKIIELKITLGRKLQAYTLL